jgi:hypothetical protein
MANSIIKNVTKREVGRRGGMKVWREEETAGGGEGRERRGRQNERRKQEEEEEIKRREEEEGVGGEWEERRKRGGDDEKLPMWRTLTTGSPRTFIFETGIQTGNNLQYFSTNFETR